MEGPGVPLAYHGQLERGLGLCAIYYNFHILAYVEMIMNRSSVKQYYMLYVRSSYI